RGGAARIVVLSNRADLVSGKEALVAVLLPKGVKTSALKVTIGKRNVTRSFSAQHWHDIAPSLSSSYSGLDPKANAVAGELTGLKLGANTVRAQVRGAGTAQLTITDHSLSGPVFSGPQIKPWVCQPGARDAACNRPTTFSFQYVSKATGKFAPYDPANPPTAVATTTTQPGKTVPCIVRVEHGVIDRDDYEIATLYDPTKPWTPWSPQSTFNRKALFVQGASCGNHYGEADPNKKIFGYAIDAMPSSTSGYGAQ